MTDLRIAIIGLGYVGGPLLAAFAEQYKVMGFDISPDRIDELTAGRDRTGELNEQEMSHLGNSLLTSNPEDIKGANVYIVTVPTPVNDDQTPDLEPLEIACATIGPLLNEGDTVIFESTVYPGATEDCLLYTSDAADE